MEINDDVDAQRRREECERKARRGEMDPRLEFAFQMLIDGTGLPRHQIMDHIFEGDMVSFIWWYYYQQKFIVLQTIEMLMSLTRS